MEIKEMLVTLITAVIPAAIAYFTARSQGKTDLKKLSDTNKAEIEKLMKQHEINLEAIKEQHKLEMEAKDKEQEYKLQLMQKEYELKMQEQTQSRATDFMTNAVGGLFTDILTNPENAQQKMQALKNLSEQMKNSSNGAKSDEA
ncbi:MAG: hypothetical protein E7211_21295 [Clostridium lundense]|nr:hypothetical protein [Clostridium lundense]